MPVHIKQNGALAQVTGIHVKNNNALVAVASGWIKEAGTLKQFYGSSAPSTGVSPSIWHAGTFSLPGPWSVFQQFTATGIAGPYTWGWVIEGQTGGANMSISSGQGTTVATYNATCSGSELGGGGELTGFITLNGTQYSPFILTFGIIP